MLFLGRHIENKLSETGKDGKPIYRLNDLLGIVNKMTAREAMLQFADIPGAVKIRKAK